MRFAHDRDDRNSRARPHRLLNKLPIDILLVMFRNGRHDRRERRYSAKLVFLRDLASQRVQVRDL